VIVPEPAPAVATPALLLLQVDVPDASDSVVLAPSQTTSVPVIGAGVGFTVTLAVVIQPVASVYVIVEVPAVAPLVTPEDAPMVATAGDPLLHVPPKDASLSVVTPPGQRVSVPVIDAGSGFTVTTVVT